jgi:hypothetical protein
LGGHVEIGDWVILGGLTAVHQFVKIGAHAFLAGGAIVQRDVPPYVMVAGNPAQPHAVNSEGLKRRGFSEDQVRNVRDAYRILYRSELKLAEAMEKLRALGETQLEVRAFADFIAASTRSIACIRTTDPRAGRVRAADSLPGGVRAANSFGSARASDSLPGGVRGAHFLAGGVRAAGVPFDLR